jgi:hypothetical protein
MAYFYDDLEDASRKLEEIIAQFNDKPVFFNFERRIRAIVEHMRKQDQWLAKRKEAAKLIDPSIAEITSDIAQLVDPYELIEEVPPEADCVGRVYFVRNPGSDIGYGTATSLKRSEQPSGNVLNLTGHVLKLKSRTTTCRSDGDNKLDLILDTKSN